MLLCRIQENSRGKEVYKIMSSGSCPHALRLPNYNIPSFVFYNHLCHVIIHLEHSWVFLSQGVCPLHELVQVFASRNILLENRYHFFLQVISNISIYEKENNELFNGINVISHLTHLHSVLLLVTPYLLANL